MHYRKSLKLLTAPTVEPVTVSEAKNFLRLDTSDDDTLIGTMIATARTAVENHTKRALITQTYEYKLDRLATIPGFWFINSQGEIDLPKVPIQSITSFKTYALDNTESTLSSAAYSLDGDGGRLYLNAGYSWPTNMRDFAGVLITYVAGYGDAATDVPDAFKMAILKLVASMYNNRGDCQMTDSIKGMLAPYKLYDQLGSY